MEINLNQLNYTKGERMILDKLTIYDMCLSTRVVEVFKINNITMKDILEHKYTLSDFGKLPNLGRKSMKEIKETFLTHGFIFKDNDKHFRELDHYVEAIKAKEEQVEEGKEKANNLYIDLNLEVIDKCRQALISSFDSIVKKESFSHQEFNSVMDEHKKILNMFEQNVRNVL
jgi:hypothetical protein